MRMFLRYHCCSRSIWRRQCYKQLGRFRRNSHQILATAVFKSFVTCRVADLLCCLGQMRSCKSASSFRRFVEKALTSTGFWTLLEHLRGKTWAGSPQKIQGPCTAMRFWVSSGPLGHLSLLARPPHGIPGVAVLLLSLLPFWAEANCPCRDPALCQPITQHPDFEVFVFDVGNKTWKFYDWSQITTVVIFGKYDPELMCYAHSHGARVVLKGDAPLKDIINPSFRASWIAQKVKLAKTQYMDGINIDIEQEANCLSPEYYALTTLVKETTDSFHREIKGSQVTFDVTWSPKYKDRCYNYAGIADACDFLFVMSYDEQSQALSECTAAANAPYKETLTGYDDYIKIGINPKKLVMGVPWYGYDYTCLNLLEDRVCTIPKVPSWRDSCGITSGHQVPYKVIMKQVNSSVSGSHWDKDQQASYYNYKDSSGHFHQVWYDDPQSISLKAAYIQKHSLRGIGMWHANCLDYSGDAVAKQQTEEMWKVLKPKL